MTRRDRPLYVEACLRRLLREAGDITQGNLAADLGCDRSLLSKQFSGDRTLPASELDVWCTNLDSVEPLALVAERIGDGYRVVPMDEPASVVSLERGSFRLLGAVGTYAANFEKALGDDVLDEQDRAQLRANLLAARSCIDALLASLPAEDASRQIRSVGDRR